MSRQYKFKIIKKSDDNFVVNETLNTHAHFNSYYGCICILNLIKKKVRIRDPYLKEAKNRLMPVRKKDRYLNKNMVSRVFQKSVCRV